MAVIVLLTIACASLAGLILARTEQRRRDVSIRVALGATWIRSVRQLAAESALVAVGGALCGLVLSRWIVSGFVSFELPGFLPLARIQLPMNMRVLGAVTGVSGLSLLLITLTPARAAARMDILSALRMVGVPPRGARTRLALTAVHVGLSIVLVFGAALFVRSLQQALAVDVGFDASRVLVAEADVRAARFGEAATAEYFDTAAMRIAAIPGVQSVSYGNSPFFTFAFSTPHVVIDGRETRLPRNVLHFQSGPGYFRSFGIPLLEGRDVATSDRAGGSPVAIVNRAFAQRFWPGRSALGHRVSLLPQLVNAEIVGVVDDGKYSRLDEPAQMAVFGAWQQEVAFSSTTALFVRSSDPRGVLPQVQRELRTIDGRVPVEDVRILRELVERAVLPQRLGSWLLGTFGAVALLLAVVGIHGLVAFLALERTREIGIRMALGARRGDIAALVLRSTATAVALGTVAGTTAAWWLSIFVNRLLFGVDGHDPTSLIVTIGLVVVSAVLGALVPTRRAIRVDPVVALRAE